MFQSKTSLKGNSCFPYSFDASFVDTWLRLIMSPVLRCCYLISFLELNFAWKAKKNLLMQIIVYVVCAISHIMWYQLGIRHLPSYYIRTPMIKYSINLILSMAKRISVWDVINPYKRLMKVHTKRSLVIGKTLCNTKEG